MKNIMKTPFWNVTFWERGFLNPIPITFLKLKKVVQIDVLEQNRNVWILLQNSRNYNAELHLMEPEMTFLQNAM